MGTGMWGGGLGWLGGNLSCVIPKKIETHLHQLDVGVVR